MLTPAACQALGDALAGHGYTVDAVVGAIGHPAHGALARNHTAPARRALRGRDDPLAALIRLWILQDDLSPGELHSALPGLVEPLLAARVLARRGDRIRAAVDIRPYASDSGQLWVVSDLTPGLDGAVAPIRPDFVLGVSSASSTLAELTVRRPAVRALDLGTGCGVQSLHLAGHCDHVVATEVNPRALKLAQMTFALNRVEVDLRPGSLYQPVAGERFDLIVTNPPYVMSPPTGERLVYREASMPADGLVEHVVGEGAAHLADDGILQVLGNWAHRTGQDWTDRLCGWIEPTGCDAYVVQREVMEASAYVELWLADAGLTGAPDYRQRYDAWLDYFGALGIEAVGMGWILLHRSGRVDQEVRLEDWPYALEQPIGPALADLIAARRQLGGLSDAGLLATRWRVRPDVVEETTGAPGSADPEHIVLRQQRGFRRAVAVDTALAATVGACDGELALSQITRAVATLLGASAEDLYDQVVPRARQLIVDGFLTRADG